MSKKEKILITGITGFVGSHMLDFLAKNSDAEIYGLKRPNAQLKNIQHAQNSISSVN